MNVPFLDLRRATASDRDLLDAAFKEVADSGRFVLGEAVEEFEAAFAEYCGVGYAVGLASGTSAITIALQANGVGAGDEVLTVANSCVPTVVGIEASGATAVLVDPDPASHTLDPAQLRGALSPRTRAVVPVHLYGQCADMGAVCAFAREHGLAVVEDAAQAHGAEIAGRRAGAFGAAAAYSFYPTKNLGALGDAGALVTSDPAVAERARLLRNYGERARYDSVLRGGNSRLDELQARILLARLSNLEARNARRREVAAVYLDGLGGLGLGLPVEMPGNRHVYHLFVVTAGDRDPLRARLSASGVGTMVHYPRPIHRHDAYRDLDRPGQLTVSERLAGQVVSLPLHPELTDEEVRFVVAAVAASV